MPRFLDQQWVIVSLEHTLAFGAEPVEAGGEGALQPLLASRARLASSRFSVEEGGFRRVDTRDVRSNVPSMYPALA